MQILIEHKKKYLNRRITEIAELKECLKSHDFERAGSIGHRLKGNGQTFGYPLITEIGITLEEAALNKDADKLRDSIENLAVNVEKNLKEINLPN